jgi:DNA-binding response OmpR family regulator
MRASAKDGLPTGKPARILVIEERSQLAQLKKRVAEAGYEVIAACDSQGGIEAARRHHPDLIVCGLAEPANGLEVLCTLRTDVALEMTPIVATGFSPAGENRSHVLSAGFDGYVGEPLCGKWLAAAIERHLHSGRATITPHSRVGASP